MEKSKGKKDVKESLKELNETIRRIDYQLVDCKASEFIKNLTDPDECEIKNSKMYTKMCLYDRINKDTKEFCPMPFIPYDDPSSGESSDEDTIFFNPSVKNVVETIFTEDQFIEALNPEEGCDNKECGNYKISESQHSK